MSHNHSAETTAILDGLSASPAVFEGFLRAVPKDALGRKRGQGVWTVHRHAAHLAEVQPMGLDRLRRILSEDVAVFEPFIPGNDEPAETPPLPPVDEIIARFAAVREEQIWLLKGIAPEDWEKAAVHPEYDRYGLLIFARHILMHDHWHLYRMEELWLTKDEYLTELAG